jgi:hypothetical protein
MSRIRDIANLFSANTAASTDAEVTAAIASHATASNGHYGRGTTGNRPASPTLGDLYFDTTLGGLIEYRTNGWFKVSQEPAPLLSGISPAIAATTGTTITLTGANLITGLSVKFVGTNGVEYNANVTNFISSTSATATTPNLLVAYEPYDVKVTNPDGQSVTLSDCLDVGGTPAWNTTAGSLIVITELSSLATSISATDPDGGAVTYSSSNLPAWVSLNSSTGALTGTAPDIASNTTYSFDVTASDSVNSLSRSFSITVNNSVPPTSVDYLVVAGGGSGGNGDTTGLGGGGGGAGGLRTSAGPSGGGSSASAAFSVTAGTNYTVTVGNGGVAPTVSAEAGGYGNQGQSSVFGSITTVGGGGGAKQNGNGLTGGSGGGAGYSTFTGGTGTANQGYAGGNTSGQYASAGGGGAGAVGNPPTSSKGGDGGIGVLSSITGTATYYAGGGGGGGYTALGTTQGLGGSGGGGNGGNQNSGIAGSSNTGGGGGGAGVGYNSAGYGGAGGSGVVIIAYPDTFKALVVGSGLTYDQPTRAGYRVYRFTAGTGTVSWA